jgi:hypothetical protein
MRSGCSTFLTELTLVKCGFDLRRYAVAGSVLVKLHLMRENTLKNDDGNDLHFHCLFCSGFLSVTPNEYVERDKRNPPSSLCVVLKSRATDPS